MKGTIDQGLFVSNLFEILDETFENHHGIFLDRGTSLLQTLESISPTQASIPVGGKCASLAAQVAHVEFYLGLLERLMQGEEVERVDWGEIWRTYCAVTPEEWAELKGRLEATYRRVSKTMHGIEDWDDDRRIGGAMASVAHTPYHLGEIRQALCTLR